MSRMKRYNVVFVLVLAWFMSGCYTLHPRVHPRVIEEKKSFTTVHVVPFYVTVSTQFDESNTKDMFYRKMNHVHEMVKSTLTDTLSEKGITIVNDILIWNNETDQLALFALSDEQKETESVLYNEFVRVIKNANATRDKTDTVFVYNQDASLKDYETYIKSETDSYLFIAIEGVYESPGVRQNRVAKEMTKSILIAVLSLGNIQPQPDVYNHDAMALHVMMVSRESKDAVYVASQTYPGSTITKSENVSKCIKKICKKVPGPLNEEAYTS